MTLYVLSSRVQSVVVMLSSSSICAAVEVSRIFFSAARRQRLNWTIFAIFSHIVLFSGQLRAHQSGRILNSIYFCELARWRCMFLLFFSVYSQRLFLCFWTNNCVRFTQQQADREELRSKIRLDSSMKTTFLITNNQHISCSALGPPPKKFKSSPCHMSKKESRVEFLKKY